MKVTVFKDERALAKTLAARIAAMLTGAPALVLGLPTGRTPVRMYHELGNLYSHQLADFSQATTFNLDEFLGIGPDHPGSYRAFMEQHLFSRVNIQPARRPGVVGPRTSSGGATEGAPATRPTEISDANPLVAPSSKREIGEESALALRSHTNARHLGCGGGLVEATGVPTATPLGRGGGAKFSGLTVLSS